jgi:hypothetical protein
MTELQQPWDSFNGDVWEKLSDEIDIRSTSESESVYSATESDKKLHCCR